LDQAVHIVSTPAAGAVSPIKVFETEIDDVQVVVAVLESPDRTGDALTPSGQATMDFMGRYRFVNARAGAVHFVEVTPNDTTGAQVRQAFGEARRARKLNDGDAYIVLASSQASCQGVLEALGCRRADEPRRPTFGSRVARAIRNRRIWDNILWFGCVAAFVAALSLTLCSDIPPWIGP
jgi:hypothetical protein